MTKGYQSVKDRDARRAARRQQKRRRRKKKSRREREARELRHERLLAEIRRWGAA
jgi:hypothetical protein